MTPPDWKPRDSEITRQGILNAALDLFAEEGFETVGVRAIGARANVDPSLINRYFGGKDQLFAAVLQACNAEWRRLWGDADTFPERIAEEILHGPRRGVVLQGMMILMRSSGSEHARQIIDDTLDAAIFTELETWMKGEDADARARLLVALIAGMAVAKDISGDFAMTEDRTNALKRSFTEAMAWILTPQPNAR